MSPRSLAPGLTLLVPDIEASHIGYGSPPQLPKVGETSPDGLIACSRFEFKPFWSEALEL